jgi:hypothetical protein
MEHCGVEFRILQTIPKGWRWEFARDGIARNGTGFDRQNAINRARKAIDAIVESSTDERSNWQIGQRVSRGDGVESGTVVRIESKITVKWDGGWTSQFSTSQKASVE